MVGWCGVGWWLAGPFFTGLGICTDPLKYACSQLGPVKTVVIWGTQATIPGGHCFDLSMSVPMFRTGLKHPSLSYLGLVLGIQRVHRGSSGTPYRWLSVSKGTLSLSLETSLNHGGGGASKALACFSLKAL